MAAMCPLLLLACTSSPDGPDDSPSGDDSSPVDDSTPPDDSTPIDDTSDDTGTEPPPPGWSCDVESTRLDMSGVVSAWSAPGDGVAVDMTGPIEAWNGSAWQTVGSLDGPGRAVDGGADGTVWIVGHAPDAHVREDGTWRTEPLPKMAASVVDVSVTNAADAVVLWTGFDPKCSTCEWNFVTIWDGTGFTTVQDPTVNAGPALAIEELSDGRHVVVGDYGYARVVDHGVWSDVDTDKTTDTLFDVAEISKGVLAATGENGLLYVGNPEHGLQRLDTKWSGDFVAIHPDGAGGAWLLSSPFTTTRDDVSLLHWNGEKTATLLELPGSGTWYGLSDGPSGEVLVLGGETGSVFAVGSDAGIVPTWRIPGIAPLSDLAVAGDGTVYTTAARARAGVFGRYDGGWDSVDLGGAIVLDEVEATSHGDVLFLTTDDVWRWDGEVATLEPLPADTTWAGMVADGDDGFVAGWSYDDEEVRSLTLAMRDELGWIGADVASLPGVVFFSLALDGDGTLWLAGFDQNEGYLASWTAETGAAVVHAGMRSVAFGLWPKADGGLWVLLDGDTKDRGFYSFDGKSLTLELADLEGFFGVRDVLEVPGVGPVAAAELADGTLALMVRGEDGAWSPIAGVRDEIHSLAALDDGTIVAGTTTGALTLENCAYE
jgi:hypothetical protein